MTDIVMGFDFGKRRIGIAVGQSVTGTASPVGIVNAREGKPEWQKIDKLVEEWQPGVLVVGLPINMDDSGSEMSAAAERFGRRLHGRYHLPVEMMDERLSTFEAREFSDEAEVDAIAARLILESWLQLKHP
ncbi:MAG: Holliday junction resolvase RuvX [Proteobacteria bacterium]|nr:Holliday junction resolvase RuvX [Pseudomonadota bacterium]